MFLETKIGIRFVEMKVETRFAEKTETKFGIEFDEAKFDDMKVDETKVDETKVDEAKVDFDQQFF